MAGTGTEVARGDGIAALFGGADAGRASDLRQPREKVLLIFSFLIAVADWGLAPLLVLASSDVGVIEAGRGTRLTVPSLSLVLALHFGVCAAGTSALDAPATEGLAESACGCWLGGCS